MTTGNGWGPPGAPPFDVASAPTTASLPEAAPASPAAPPGLPDPGLMARWANEFFAALPDGSPVAPPGLPAGVDSPAPPGAPAVPHAGSAGTGSVPVASSAWPSAGSSAGSGASTVPQLGEKDFRAAPQQLRGGAEKAPQVAGQRPSHGASPASVPGSALYFIEAASGARGMLPGDPAILPYPSLTHPLPQFSESDFRAAPQSIGGSTGTTAPSPQARAALPSAPGAATSAGSGAPLYFLEFKDRPHFLELKDRPHAPASAPAPALPVANQAAPHEEHVARDGGESFGLDPVSVRDLKLDTRQFDAAFVKRDFPILDKQVNGRSLVWLDNAATTQKPRSVIDRIAFFYEHENSNIHRGGAHTLAGRATEAYEGARETVRAFINAPSAKNIVFTRGTTESVNLVSQSWGRRYLQKDDEVVITWLEHHSNIVPWQLICAERGARLRVAPIDGDGQIKLDEYERLLGPRTRLVAFTQVSNALGTVTPAAEMIAMAHRHGAKVLLDGAQSVSHMRVDVQALDCDFFVFSGHKVFGPTGIGALYGKAEALESMPPWQGGGNMITDVTFEKTTYQPPPMRFEAGTGNIADAVGLAAAIDYVEHLGLENIGRHEHDLLAYGTEGLEEIPGLRLIGTAREKAAVMSFVIDGIPYEVVAQALGNEGIAVRAGHHCAQPAVRHFGLEGTVRPSLALYNTYADVDALLDTLRRLVGNRGSRRS